MIQGPRGIDSGLAWHGGFCEPWVWLSIFGKNRDRLKSAPQALTAALKAILPVYKACFFFIPYWQHQGNGLDQSGRHVADRAWQSELSTGRWKSLYKIQLQHGHLDFILEYQFTNKRKQRPSQTVCTFKNRHHRRIELGNVKL